MRILGLIAPLLLAASTLAATETQTNGMSYEARTESMILSPELEAGLRAIAVARAPDELAAVGRARSEEEFFYALPSAAMAAYRLGRYDEAKSYAEQSLSLAPSFQQNWNYGNAIHFAHTALGLVALRKNDLESAVRELHEAGATPGSPQLDSFGPSMELAKALLRHGESAAVLSYLQQCRAFWQMGGVWLDLWEQKIGAGGVPNFFMHSYR